MLAKKITKPTGYVHKALCSWGGSKIEGRGYTLENRLYDPMPFTPSVSKSSKPLPDILIPRGKPTTRLKKEMERIESRL